MAPVEAARSRRARASLHTALEAAGSGVNFWTASRSRRARRGCDVRVTRVASKVLRIRPATMAPRLQSPRSAPPFCTRGDPVVETRSGLLVFGVRNASRDAMWSDEAGTRVAGTSTESDGEHASCFDNGAFGSAYCMRGVRFCDSCDSGTDRPRGGGDGAMMRRMQPWRWQTC